jgi:hypothetical protein
MSCSDKFLAKKRLTPIGTPSVTRTTKIAAIDTTADAVPMISGLVSLDIINQKMYPENIEIIVLT